MSLWRICISILLEIIMRLATRWMYISFRFRDFISLLKDVVCPGLVGITLRMMKGLALVENLASVWLKGRLNHGQYECKQCCLKNLLYCVCCPEKLYKPECEMWGAPLSFSVDWFDKFGLWTMVHCVRFYWEFEYEELLLAWLWLRHPVTRHVTSYYFI